MCKFFSFVGDGHGNWRYFDWAIRQQIIAGNLNYEHDSHTSILEHFKVPKEKQDLWSKYEYNPLTKHFLVDYAVEGHDGEAALNWVKSIGWENVVEPLLVKPIVHPFKVEPPKKITEKHLKLLREWASVWASVWDSVGVSVGVSVWASVGVSVWDRVWDSVGVSVGDSVGVSVRVSVWDSVGAYASSFFPIKYKHDFSPCVKLWEMGLVPSFDGKVWRLHGHEDARVLWEGKIESQGAA